MTRGGYFVKKTILIFSFLSILQILCFGQEQSNLDGFSGINWNETLQNAEKIMTEKEFIVVSKDNNDLMLKGKFAGENATIILSFFDEKFYRAIVIYEYERNRALSKYNSYVSLMSERYGKPNESIERYISPYYKGDGYEEQAIRMNKGIVSSKWLFNNNCTINVVIVSNLNTYLVYTHESLAQLREDAEKKSKANEL
jgi:hypothetical protein